MARKAPLRKRLRELVEQEDRGRRELGILVVQMHRSDHLDEEELGERAAQLAGLHDEMAEIRRDLGEATEPIAAGAATLPPAAEEAAERKPDPIPEQPEPIEAEAETRPSVEELTVQLEDAEQRVRAAVDAARRDAEDRATAEILALEEDLEREQQRATEALERLQAELEEAQRRASQAEQERGRIEAEARSAAAEWLRGQAEAMRREAERQVREELAAAGNELSASAGRQPSAPAPAPTGSADKVSLASATFEQLRELGMSISQADRVIAYRERLGGYESVDDLDAVPGFQRDFLAEIKTKIEV